MIGRPVAPNEDGLVSDPSECEFVLDNLEGFALDALDGYERGMIEHHLRWCRACRAEVAATERIVELLPFAVSPTIEAHSETRSALLARITQAQPEPASMGETTYSPHEVPPTPATGTEIRAPWWKYASTALIAPLALALLVMGVWANSLQSDLSDRQQELANQVLLNDALSNGGQVQLYSVQQTCPTCLGSGRLGVSESNDMGMLVGWNFNPGQQHDVWGVSSDGEKQRVCQLHIESSGSVMQMFSFPEAPSRFTDVYITDENGTLIYVSHLGNGASDIPDGEGETPLPNT